VNSIRLLLIEATRSAEKILLRKSDPEFLLVVCSHFAFIWNHFRVICDFLLAAYTSNVIDMLDDVTDRR
jgi:hypothetical protein